MLSKNISINPKGELPPIPSAIFSIEKKDSIPMTTYAVAIINDIVFLHMNKRVEGRLELPSSTYASIELPSCDN